MMVLMIVRAWSLGAELEKRGEDIFHDGGMRLRDARCVGMIERPRSTRIRSQECRPC
jgi:hypothetical protein